MTGPTGGPLGAGCQVFDFNVNSGTDGLVDMADFWTMQRAAGADGACTFGKKHTVLARQTAGVAVTGVSAQIVTRTVTLCQEGVATPKGQSSNANVTVMDAVNLEDSNTWYWAQTGYVKFQNPGEATVNFGVFAELKVPTALPNDWQPDLLPDPNQPTVNDFHEYECKKTVATDGKWYFRFDNNSWKMFSHSAWVNHTGTSAKYGAEIHNKEDKMVGTENVKCVFKEIKAASQYNVFGYINIVSGDLKSSDFNEWQIKKSSNPNEIEVWRVVP